MEVDNFIVYRLITKKELSQINEATFISSPENKEFTKGSLKDHIEMVFENVRKEKFEYIHTTRLNSIFVCYSKENAKYWSIGYSDKEFYIFKLQATGELNWFDAQYYNRYEIEKLFRKYTDKDFEKDAIDYWSSMNDDSLMSDNSRTETEGLLVGKAKIVGIETYIKNHK